MNSVLLLFCVFLCSFPLDEAGGSGSYVHVNSVISFFFSLLFFLSCRGVGRERKRGFFFSMVDEPKLSFF